MLLPSPRPPGFSVGVYGHAASSYRTVDLALAIAQGIGLALRLRDPALPPGPAGRALASADPAHSALPVRSDAGSPRRRPDRRRPRRGPAPALRASPRPRAPPPPRAGNHERSRKAKSCRRSSLPRIGGGERPRPAGPGRKGRIPQARRESMPWAMAEARGPRCGSLKPHDHRRPTEEPGAGRGEGRSMGSPRSTSGTRALRGIVRGAPRR